MPSLSLPAPVAVIDLETTGLFPGRHDRVIEIAAVVVGPTGQIEREFVSLVNPGRDIGPSRIHGLSAEDLLDAPPFADMAALLVEQLDGAVAIAAHNLRFDRQFLESEFARLGHELPDCEGLCTMELGWGGSLASCCSDYGITFSGDAHHALVDARAAADLLVCLLADQPHVVARLAAVQRVSWPALPRTNSRPVTRDESRKRNAVRPTYLEKLLERASDLPQTSAPSGATLAYTELLDRVLEDRRVEGAEGDALVATAAGWGLTPKQVREVHRGYLTRLARAALADGVVTDAEKRDIELVARLLGVTEQERLSVLEEVRATPADNDETLDPQQSAESLAGKRVCFTGEMLCRYRGQLMTRDVCEELAAAAGLTVADSVTKKLDVLVVADPHTQSGKAKKARQYGVRVMHEPVFWQVLKVPVS